MFGKCLRRLAVAGFVVAAVLLSTSNTYAMFPWYDASTGQWVRPAPLRTVAAPVYYKPAAVACDTCPPANPCTPQTCRRLRVVGKPIVLYRPALGCNPCSGWWSLHAKPMTLYLPQLKRVPVACPRPACVTCGPVLPGRACPCGPAATVQDAAVLQPPTVQQPTTAEQPAAKRTFQKPQMPHAEETDKTKSVVPKKELVPLPKFDQQKLNMAPELINPGDKTT